MSMRKVLKLAILVCLAAIILPTSSNATLLNVDEIIYQTETGVNATDPDVLAGTVDMTFDGSTLEITLTNTSTDVASLEASYNLLTGLGFNLPDALSISIGFGSVSMEGSTAINFTAPVDNDVSGEWGYDNDPLNAGPFQNPPAGETYSTVNTVVSSMESSSKDGVFGTSLFGPDTLDGPEFGLLSSNVNSAVAGGLYAIQDSIILSLTLDGSWSGDLIGFIDDGDVVLSFGSPNASSVPEPATLLLLGSGLLGLAGFRKKFRKG